jgi:hypothetical protein
MFIYNPPKYLDHKIHNMIVFLSFHFHLLCELNVKSLYVSRFTLSFLVTYLHFDDFMQNKLITRT